MARLFGTDGVRGVANDELTPMLAMQLGQAGAYVLTKENKHKPTIMVGCDTRISGDMLANALMAGICSVGANAVYVGDSEVDIETAENAGLDAVLVSWGFRDREFLQERGAKTLVDTANELKSALIHETF